MIFRTLVLSIALIAGASGVIAECSQAALQEKAVEISTKAQALAAVDPQKMQFIMGQLQEASVQMATANPTELQTVCDAFDELIEALEQS